MTHGVGSPKASRTTVLLASAVAALALLGAAAPSLLVANAAADQPPPIPDLRVASVGLGQPSPFGPSITVTITNEGGAPAEDFRIVVATAGGTPIMDIQHSWLFDGSSVTYFTYDAPVLYGPQTLQAEVDVDNNVTESDETDNLLVVDIDFGWPDLIATFGDVTYSAMPGTAPGDETVYTAFIPVHVRNIGTAPAFGATATIDGLTATPQPLPPGGLQPGSHATFWFTWQGPAGERPITAVADPQNDVPESDEDNNEASVTLRPGLTPDLPDLVITEVGLTPATVDHGTQLTFRVENLGSADAPATHLEVGFDDGTVRRIDVIALPADHVTWYSTPWPTGPGRHTVQAQIDPDNLIEEQDERNNHAWFEAGEDLPDLVIRLDAPDTSGKAYGDDARVTVQVSNIGGAPAPASVAVLNDGPRVVDIFQVPALAPGATFVGFAEIRLTPGLHRLAAEADVDHAALERDEQNNVGVHDLDLGTPSLQVTGLSQDQEVPEEGITMYVATGFAYSGALGLGAVEARLYDGDLLLATWTLHDVTDGEQHALGFAWNANEGSHTLRFQVRALGTGAEIPATAADDLPVDVRAPTPETCKTAGVTPDVQETCRRLLLGEAEPAGPLLG